MGKTYSDKRFIQKLKIDRALLQNRYITYLLVPALTISSGAVLDKIITYQMPEYLTITRSFTGKDGKIIGSVNSYDAEETDHVITVLKCEPWQQLNNKYVRKITAYEYSLDETLKKDYHITEDDIDNIREKYQYIEEKINVPAEELKGDTIIYVKETYQDKGKVSNYSRFIVPICLASLGIGVVIDLIIKWRRSLNNDEIQKRIRRLSREIEAYEKNNQLTIK